MKEKKTNYEVELKSSVNVIEEKIAILKMNNNSIMARKIKTQFGEFWLRENDFLLLFQKKNELF